MPKYYESREVESFTLDSRSPERVVVSFKEGEPKTEDMNVKEWEAGVTDEPVIEPARLQELLVKRSTPIRQELQNVFKKFNPRFSEIPHILTWVNDALVTGYQTAVDAVFGIKNFSQEVTIDQICLKLEEHGVDVTAGMTDAQKAVFLAIRSNGITSFEIVHSILFTTLTAKINQLTERTVSLALGGTDETRRCDDLEQYRDTSKDYDSSPKEQGQVGSDAQAVTDGPVEHPADGVSGSQDQAGVASEDAGVGEQKSD